MNFFKNHAGWVITLVLAAGGAVFGYGRLNADLATVKEKVESIDKDGPAFGKAIASEVMVIKSEFAATKRDVLDLKQDIKAQQQVANDIKVSMAEIKSDLKYLVQVANEEKKRKSNE